MDITRYLPDNEYKAALAANAPTALNPFATIADLSGLGGEDLAATLGIGNTTGGNNIALSVAGDYVSFTNTNHGAILRSLDNLVNVSLITGNFFFQNNIANGSVSFAANGTNGQINFNSMGGMNSDNLLTYNSAVTTIAAIDAAAPRVLVSKEWVNSKLPTPDGSIYANDGTIGAGRVATLTSTLDFSGALRLNVNGSTIFNNSSVSTGDLQIKGLTDDNLFRTDASADTVQIGSSTSNSSKLYIEHTDTLTNGLYVNNAGTNAASYGIRSRVVGANSGNVGLYITTQGATNNRAIYIDGGEIWQANEEVKNTFGYNVPAHLQGTLSVGMNTASTQTTNFDSLLNNSNNGTYYGYRSRNFSGAGGTGTVYGYEANITTNAATQYGYVAVMQARGNAKESNGFRSFVTSIGGVAQTGKLTAGFFTAGGVSTATYNDLVGIDASADLNAGNITANNLTAADISSTVSNASTVNNDVIGAKVQITNSGTISGDQIGIDVTMANSGTLTGTLLAAKFNADIEITGGTNGTIYEDRTSAARWRLYIDNNGVVNTELA